MVLTSKYSTFHLICLLIFYPVHLSSLRLSESKVLLPYNKGLPSNYTLKITGSDTESPPDECFVEWKSSNPHIVSVIPLFMKDECSKSAILSCVGNLLEREVTYISVTEKTSGKTLYIEAYTDTVENIEFEHVTDELFLGGSPEKISIFAKDKEGHRFTSISGLEIKWQVTSHFDETIEEHGSDVVKLARLYTSNYEASAENELESRGLLSSTVLAEPLEVGTAVINASLLFHGKPVLKTKHLKLVVLPNVIIRPPTPLYLIRHSKVNVTLEKRFRNDENLEFEIDVDDTSIADIKGLTEIHAKEYGDTSINIQSQYMKSQLEVHVVKVARIGFRISNGNYTMLEQLTVYEFFIDLFDEEGNKIHVSENLRVDVKFPPKFFHIIHTSSNGTYFIVQTTSPGKSKIRAEFKGVLLEDDSIAKENSKSGNPVSSTIGISVCQRLSIFPPYTLLPVLERKPMHKITLKAFGGTGNYVWSLNNYEVANIVPLAEKNNSVDLEIYSEIYDLIITIIDLGNINFIAKAQVSCQTALDLEVYPAVVEAEVDNFIIIPVALLGYEDRDRNIIRKFDDCSMINFTMNIVDPYVISYEKDSDIPAFGKGCKSASFKCRAAGHSRINIGYTMTGRNISYNTTTVLACFKPLKPVYPVRVAVLALGTSIELAFDGGPRQWALYKAGHITELLPSDSDLVEIELIKDPVRYNRDLTVFRVKCLAIGENTLTFKISNEKSATLPHPANSEASIKFICSEPDSLHLKLFRKNSKQKLDDNVVKVPFYGDKNFEVDLYVKDKIGRKFANITSLRILWDVDDKSLASPVTEFDFESFENAVSGYRKLSRNFMKFQMTGDTGLLKIEGKITSYRKDVLEKEGIGNYKELEKEIQTTINLKLVSLRDLNNDIYDSAKERKDVDGYCENDSCKS